MNPEHAIPHAQWKKKFLLFYEYDSGWNTHERDWEAIEIPQNTWEYLYANMSYRIEQEEAARLTCPAPSFDERPIFDPGTVWK